MGKRELILVADNDEVLNRICINLVSKYAVRAIVSNELHASEYKIPLYDFSWLEQQDLTRYLLVIADNKNMVVFIRKFRGMNLELIENWVPHWMIDTCEIDPLVLYEFVGKDILRFRKAIEAIKKYKKIVVIHGNCQTFAIRYYLKFSHEFADRYVIFIMPQLWNPKDIEKFKVLYEIEVFSYIDILITQNVSKGNKFGEIVSTENVLENISCNCEVIKICNCYLDTYYPQYIRKNEVDENRSGINRNGLNVFKNKVDINVVEQINKGKKLNEILDYICDENLYERKYLLNQFWDEIAQTKKREEECDIKICDFIEDNIMSELLFEANMHPTEIVFIEICKRILKRLGISQEEVYFDGSIHALGIPGDERIPMYPSVIKQLGLDVKYANLLYKLPTGKKVSFREYMEAYIKIVFPGVNTEE